MEGKGYNNKPAFSWEPVFDLSRTGFALWVWSGMVRCHDGLVLCLLGAALSALQADTCLVIYKIFRKFKWSFGVSLFIWIALFALTWVVVYENSRS
jgi:hypothetical protein